MAFNLTKDAIAMISNGVVDMKPVLQVADVRLLNTGQSNTERYRMLLSDGTHLQQAMLATQMNHAVKSGILQKGSIIQLTQFICNLIQNRKIIIVVELTIIAERCDPIGEPKQYVDGATQGRTSFLGQSPPISHPGTAGANAHSGGGSLANSSVTGQTVAVSSYMNPEVGSASNPQSSVTKLSGSHMPDRAVTTGITQAPKVESNIGASGNLQVNHKQTFPVAGAIGGSLPFSKNYGPQAQSIYNQPPPIFSNRGPIAKNEAPARIVPIAALNPYQNRWTIKARVTAKGELRRYNNPRGEGKVFSFDVLDSDGGEIRLTCFNTVADQFYDLVEVGKVYMISKGNLKPSQKNFNHLNNAYEIFLESTSIVEPCLDEDNIPRQQFNFRSIGDIEGMDNNSMVDLIGIVTSINPSSTIMRKNGIETHKRTLQLKDMSGRSVELTLWGNFCNSEGEKLQGMCDSGVLPVLAVKAGRVNDFSGKTVGTISTSQLFIDPDFPEARRLKDWFNTAGKNTVSISISRDTSSMGRNDTRKTVSQIKDEGLGRSDKPDWITVKAAVSFVKVDNFCYTACPLMVGDRTCNKKVNNNGDGTWHCERCDQTFPECDYRYLLQLQVQDHTGLTWVTAFQEGGEEIMGISAKDLYLMKYEVQDETKFNEIIRKVLFAQYMLKLKVKEETFSDEQRVKSIVVKAEKVNFSSECKYLLGLIDKLCTEDSGAIHGRFANGVSDSGISSATFGNVGFQQGTHPVGSSAGSNTNEKYKMASVNHEAQYGSMHTAVAGRQGDQGVYLICSSCGSVGHGTENCPRWTNRQVHSSYNSALPYSGEVGDVSGKCFKCNQSGHWAKDCPGLSSIPSPYGSSGSRYGVSRQ